MLRTIIIDDEKNSRKLLQIILVDYCPEIELLGIASDIYEGKKMIEELAPDLVFLDVQLGEMTGFQMLDTIVDRTFNLVVTSANDHYALKSFEYEALSYVLKPFSPHSIVAAVNRVKKITGDYKLYKKLAGLVALKNENQCSKFSVSTDDAIHILNHSDIVRLTAHRSYSEISLKCGKTIFTSKSIGEIEKRLPHSMFYRVHSGHLVNMNYVQKISNQDGGFLVMHNDNQVPLARRRRKEFIALMQA